MPNTIIAFRYGTPANEGDQRPSILRLQHPTWTLSAQPRIRFPERMQTTPAVKGNYLNPLTNNPSTMELDLLLRQRRGADRLHVGNPVAAINSIRNLREQPLTVQWGAELDWGDGWYLTGVDVGFEVPAQYPRDTRGPNPSDGGMVFASIGVRVSLVSDAPSLTAPVLIPQTVEIGVLGAA